MLLSISAWALALISITIVYLGPKRFIKIRFKVTYKFNKIISFLKYRFLINLFFIIFKVFLIYII